MDIAQNGLFIGLCIFLTTFETIQAVNTFGGYIDDPLSVLSNEIIINEEDCLNSCKKYQTRCVGATYVHNTKLCRLHMNWSLMCKARINWASGYTHFQTLPCRQRLKMKNKHYKFPTTAPVGQYQQKAAVVMKGDQRQVAASCLNIAFTTFHNFHALGGTEVMSGTSVLQCKELCKANSTCISFDWNRSTGGCFFHFQNVQTIPNACCVRALKVCGDTALTPLPPTTTTGTTTTTTTTTTPIPTTQGPNVLINTTIPDDGVCPSPFLRLDNMQIMNGALITPADMFNTTERCKRVCLDNANCAAVDFNLGTGQCFLHPAVAGSSLGTLIPANGIVHFRRTNCTKTCYQHAAMMVSSTDATTVTQFQMLVLNDLPAALTVGTTLTAVDCPNDCFFRQTLVADTTAGTLTFTFERGCSMIQTTPNCTTSVVGTTMITTTTTCFCNIDRCNGPGVDSGLNKERVCLAYYSFDNNLLDGSQFMRNGFNVNGVTFDSIVAQKNFSAMFSGSNYVTVRPFQNLQLGLASVTAMMVQYSPDLTIALWVYTTGMGDMTILSNGIRTAATLELRTVVSGNTQQFTGTVVLGTLQVATFGAMGTMMPFSVTSSAVPTNQWVYVILRLVSSPAQLEIYAANDPLSGVPDATTAVTSTNPVLPIGGELCIGKQYTVVIPGNPILQPSFNFVGKLDELYMFNSAYSVRSLASLRDLSSPFP